MKNQKIKGVIFDLDGTLIDSMNIWYNTDRKFLKENGVENPPEDISERVKKLTIDKASELFIKEFNLNCTVDYIIKRIECIKKDERYCSSSIGNMCMECFIFFFARLMNFSSIKYLTVI